VNQQAGFVAIALAGLWIAYLVPHRLRYRQQLLESRADDRFSEHLRVLRVAQATSGSAADVRHHARPSSAQLHPALPAGRERRAGRGGRSMDRPHAARDRIAADAARRSAAEHAQRAAHLARRAAAARRRALITVVLLLAAAGGWAAVAATGAALLVGAVPTVLLVAVLGLGRRAVLAGARADAEWEAGAATRLPAPARAASVVGRAVRPSDAVTEVMARVPSEATDASTARTVARVSAAARAASAADAAAEATTTAAAHDDGRATDRSEPSRSASRAAATERTADSEASTWEPVPVPRPAYTLKPVARRGEPAPLVLDDASAAPAAAAARDEVTADEATAPSYDGAASRTGTSTARPAVGGVDLDGILARRRAAGE
jgi:hypothetical protein